MRLAVGTAKYLLFFFNFIFFITGIVIIAVASLVIIKEKEKGIAEHLDEGFQSVPIFLIVVGLFVAGIAFFGCCGAIRNSYCMLMTFAALLGIIFIFEFGAGIAAYTKKDDVTEAVKKAFDSLMEKYRTDNSTRDAVDELQQAFGCCGSNSSHDWDVKGGVPDSCCAKVDSKYVKCNNDTTFKKGCYDAFTNFITDNITTIGAVGVGIAFIQILGIVLSCCLATAVKEQV